MKTIAPTNEQVDLLGDVRPPGTMAHPKCQNLQMIWFTLPNKM